MKSSISKYTKLISVIFVFVCMFYFIAINNFNLMGTLSCGSSTDSALYKFSMERMLKIYRDAPDKTITRVLEKTSRNIESNKDSYPYLVFIGVTGDNRSSEFVISEMNKGRIFEDFLYKDANAIYFINALGMSGSEKSIKYLENLLNKVKEDYESKSVHSRYFHINFIIARSLYFLTGERYSYRGRIEYDAKLPNISRLQPVREAVQSSQGRKRTLKEMLGILHFTFPPKRNLQVEELIKKELSKRYRDRTPHY